LRFIDALRLRTIIFSTRAVLARADKKIYVACRRCRDQPENLGHILGLCQYTKGLRIKRHDEVKSILANNLRKNNEVLVEPTLKVAGNLVKSHLVIKNRESILVVDVTVRYGDRLRITSTRPYLNHLKEKFNICEGEVLPVVLGSRGAITPNTEKILRQMGATYSEIKTIIINVLRSSIEMCNVFLNRWFSYLFSLFIYYLSALLIGHQF
jgi:hypothetical protein